ncbi:hypothetical protein QL285_066834 [Trifolium repens]|nr:hypothetical protein QL285_066834 [Trifolium repens]
MLMTLCHQVSFFVCDSCYKFTTFRNLHCTCGKPMNRQPQNLDSEHQGNRTSGVFIRDNGSTFMVFDDLKIVPSSLVNSMQLLMDLGYSDLTQLEEIKHNIGKKEILNLLKYTLTSHEPLTNTLLASSSKTKENLPNQPALTFKGLPCTSIGSKMDIKVVQRSIAKLFDGNFLKGCVCNLYKSVKNLDSSECTDSNSVLLNPGLAPQFGCPNQPLNIPDVKHPTYYYGTGTPKQVYSYNYGCQTIEVSIEGGVISKTKGSIYNAKLLTPLDPRSSNRSKEVKMISIGEAEALSLLAASLTSKFTLTCGLGDLLKVSNDESTFLKVPKQEPT